MKKKFIIILILFVVFITFIAGFSNSYISRRIEHLAYVLVLGIDKGEKAKLKIIIRNRLKKCKYVLIIFMFKY